MRLLDKLTANKIRDGDVRAYEELINAHKDRVFNYCLRMAGNYHLAEELAQEVFVKVFRGIGSYDWRKAALSTWIYTISHNTCLNYLRNSRKEQHQAFEETYMDKYPSAEEQYLVIEDRERMIKALNALPPEERELVLMKDYLELKYREVGQITGVPAGTVKSRLHQVRAKIRRLLGDGDE